MKRGTVVFAALALMACSEPSAPVNTDLAAATARSTNEGITVIGNLSNALFPFDDHQVSSASGGTFTVESMTGSSGAASPGLAMVYNDHANLFLGREDNHIVRLVVPEGGSTYSLEFDLYIIGSWDGEGKQSGKQYGADDFQVSARCTALGADARVLLKTTFSNQKTVQQGYPKAGSKAGSGSYALNSLGFSDDVTVHTPTFESYGDAVYKLSFSGTNPCGTGNPVIFVWTTPSGTLQSNYDESWGVDNVRIKTDS